MRGSEFFFESGRLSIAPAGSRVGVGLRDICAGVATQNANNVRASKRNNKFNFCKSCIFGGLRCGARTGAFVGEKKIIAKIQHVGLAFYRDAEITDQAVFQTVNPTVNREFLSA